MEQSIQTGAKSNSPFIQQNIMRRKNFRIKFWNIKILKSILSIDTNQNGEAF